MKSILLHIYDDVGLEGRLQAASDLARAFSGHLTCLHATPFEDYLAADPLVVAALPEEFSEKMARRRMALQGGVEARLASEGMAWDWVHLDEIMSTALIRFSILSDLVVVSLAGAAMMKDDPRPLAAAVATGGGAPVLGVPSESSGLRLDAPVLIAWNGSPEAASAMRGSLALLGLSSRVYLLEVEERISSYPRDLAARYLSRHGIPVEILQRSMSGKSIGDIIEGTAVEVGAGLIVMGAYGHSRLREFLLGGATRSLIGESRIPLLLSH